MKYDFDEVIDRRNTDCVKWDKPAREYGCDDIIPMWVADMDFRAPKQVIDKVVECAKFGVYGYTDAGSKFNDSIISWVKRRHGVDVKKEWIFTTPGVVPAVSTAVLAFTAPGDKILIQTPVYFPFFHCIQDNDRVVVESSLKEIDGKFYMDFEDMEKQFASGVKMMILCSPHNPVGRVWTKDELEKLGNLAVKYDVKIVSDEIHSDIVFKGSKHHSMISISDEITKRTIVSMAPSKTFNVAGLSASYVIVPNEELKSRMQKVISGVHIGGLNLFGAEALSVCYNEGEEWLDALLEYLEENSRFVTDYINNNIPGVKTSLLEGTYLMWIDFRELGLDQKELNRMLIEDAKVMFNDGATFGKEGVGFMRMNIGTSRSIIEEGLKRIEKAVKKLKK